MAKLTTEIFIERAKLVHGDKYDYSKVEYIDYKTKICIVCPIHGEFWQNPYDHLKGKGCKICSLENFKYSKQSNFDEFIFKAKNIHGDKYDYSKVEYINAKTKVCVICPKHGEFWQTPDNHLHGKGCYKCGREDVSVLFTKTNDDFIKQSIETHNCYYDYCKTNYISNNKKVCIMCPKHGEFWQTPNAHLQGQGCPLCKEYKLEKEIKTFLSNNNIEFESQKHFDWLGMQSLDFYIPSINLAIECQGKQHFEPITFFGGNDEFYNTKERDLKKYILCKSNNIKLIYYTNIKKYNYFLDEKLIKNEKELINKIKENE